MKMDIIDNNTQILDDSPVDDCNVFVKYLPCDYTEKELYKLFEPYGSIVNTKVMVNIKTGNSLGYGFVRFSDANFAQEAIKNMNRVQIGYKTLLCKLSKPSTSVNLVNECPTDIENPGDPTSTLYVRILSPTITDLMLKQTFSQYGEVIESQVLIDSISGKSKRAGLIRFSNLSNSIKAYNAMNGSLHLGETPLVIKYAPNSTKVNKSTSPSLGLQSTRELSIVAQQYIQPFLLNPTSAQQSSSSSTQQQSSRDVSQSQSFHICTYSHQPHQYIYSHQDQYQQQYFSTSADVQYNQTYQVGYPTHQIFSGDTVLISSSQPNTSYYPEPYYYQVSYPIYPNSNSSSPSNSPTSSPKPNYYEQYFGSSSPSYQSSQVPQQPQNINNSILICTFKGSLEYTNLISIFSKYGELKSINININPNNSKTKCFISFNGFESAINAQQQLDKCKIGQTTIRVKFFNKKL